MTINASIYDSIDEAKKRYYLYRQQPEDDNETHLRTFKNNIDVVEYYKGNMYEDQALVEHKRRKLVETAYHALINGIHQNCGFQILSYNLIRQS